MELAYIASLAASLRHASIKAVLRTAKARSSASTTPRTVFGVKMFLKPWLKYDDYWFLYE